MKPDNSHLYKFRRVPLADTRRSDSSRRRWTRYLDEIEKEIEYTTRLVDEDKLKEAAKDPEEYDRLATLLHLRDRELTPRSGTSVETIEGFPEPEQRRHSIPFKPALEAVGGSGLWFDSSILSQSDISFSAIRSSEMGVSEEGGQYDIPHLVEKDETGPASDEDDLYVHPPTPPPEKEREPWIDRRSPYQKLFSLPEYKATRWRKGFSDSKPTDLLSVQEREEHLYNKIAADFCQWVGECELGQESVDEETILELFKVGMENPAARSVCVNPKELPLVPQHIAEAFGLPQMSEMEGVKRQVVWDAQAEREKLSGKNSGKSKAGTEGGIEEAWFSTPLLRQELHSGDQLWQHLQDSKIFKHFCDWLMANPEYEKPKYLVQKGCFKKKYDIGEKEGPAGEEWWSGPAPVSDEPTDGWDAARPDQTTSSARLSTNPDFLGFLASLRRQVRELEGLVEPSMVEGRETSGWEEWAAEAVGHPDTVSLQSSDSNSTN